MQSNDRSFDLIVRQAGAEHARRVGETITPIFVGVFRSIDKLAESLIESLRVSSPDEQYLAGARNHAEFRQRLHDLEQRHRQIALEPGR